MVPQTGSGPATEDRFAHGNGDLLLRLARDLEAHGASTLVVSSSDHVFSAELDSVVAEHRSAGLVATVLTAEVSPREASANVTVMTQDGLVSELEEKPEEPRTGRVLTELFVYEVQPLLTALRELRAELSGEAEGDDSGIGDFADHLLPRLVQQRQVRAVPLAGYWRDLGRPSAYLQGHRDLLAGEVDALTVPGRPVISKWQDRTAARLRRGAVVEDSLVSPGCDVAGEVVRSVLGPGVVVEAGARVEDCVLFEDVVVRRGATLTTSLVDERCVVGPDATVGSGRSTDGAAAPPADSEITMLGVESTVGASVVLAAGSRLEPGTTA